MGENIATPRISHAYLEAFANQTVRIVGRVTQLRGEQATLDASGGDVTLILTRDSHLKLDNGAEVVGRVNPDLTIKVLAATDLGSSVGE
ncbi:MAG: hypothetical protein M1838_005955 [Thelocarpon superellum]|nr:MAG: hypothetical protein M1838_005955 [Thelocarpon superellum]